MSYDPEIDSARRALLCTGIEKFFEKTKEQGDAEFNNMMAGRQTEIQKLSDEIERITRETMMLKYAMTIDVTGGGRAEKSGVLLS